MQIWRITHETRSFIFEAFGATPEQAAGAMLRAFVVHAAQCGLDSGWARAEADEIEEFNGRPIQDLARPIDIGEGYRDRERIT